MKKLTFILLLLLSSSFAYSQTHDVSLRLGLGENKYLREGTNFRISPELGASYGYNFVNRAYVTGEVFWSQYASEREFESIYGDYITIAVGMKSYLSRGFYLYFAPEIKNLISATNSADENLQEDFNKSIFGLNVGAGYKLPFGMLMDVKYSNSLSAATKQENFKMQGIVLSIGYSLPFDKMGN